MQKPSNKIKYLTTDEVATKIGGTTKEYLSPLDHELLRSGQNNGKIIAKDWLTNENSAWDLKIPSEELFIQSIPQGDEDNVA